MRLRRGQQRGRCGGALPVRRWRGRDAPRTASPAMATSGTGTSPAPATGRATAFASTGRGIRRRGCAATRPSCCSTPMREPSWAACDGARPSTATRGRSDARPPIRRRSCRAPWSCARPFDWGDDRPPGTALADSVIYELHVKGFTRLHPEVPEALRGTYAGLGHPAAIAHLQRLGVTAVELLPVHQLVHDGRSSRAGCATTGATSRSATSPPTTSTRRRATTGAGRGVQGRWCSALHAAGLEVHARRRLQPHRRG